MRILHVISSIDPAGGGPIEGIQQLARIAINNGHHIEVASLDSPEAKYVKEFPLTIHAQGPGCFAYGFSSRFVPWLRANRNRFDVVVVNGLWRYSSFAVWWALRNTSTPYVTFTHGMLDPWFKRRYPIKHLKKLLYWPWAECRVLRDAKAVLFTCEEERLLARQSFPFSKWNEVIVNYGTAGPPIGAQEATDAFFARIPELRGRRFFLFVGRVDRKKGCDLLIDAFARVASESEIDLVIVGPDTSGWQPELVRLAAERGVEKRITWTGMLQGACKWGAYFAAEAFVLPSHSENFGIVVAEAMACGVPVLISNKVNIWREVTADGAGLAAADDLEETVRMLQRWLEMSPSDRKSMGERSRVSFFNRFEIRRAATSLVTALDIIMANSVYRNS